jgi:hypothetical protein
MKRGETITLTGRYVVNPPPTASINAVVDAVVVSGGRTFISFSAATPEDRRLLDWHQAYAAQEQRTGDETL